MKNQLTFGYRCLHGISLLTVCTIPIEKKFGGAHSPWKLVPISNQLCDTLCMYIKLFMFLCIAFAVKLIWCSVTICSEMLNLS